MTDEKRAELVWIVVAVPAILVAIGQSGFFFAIPMKIGIAIVLASGVLGGMLRGREAVTRLLYSVAFAVVGTGILFATIAYTRNRETMVNYELLIPGFGGAIPGLVIFWLVSRWEKARATSP